MVTGPAVNVTRLQQRLAGDDIEGRPLHISAAAHSALVDSVADEFRRCVSRVKLSPPAIPWISDRTGAPVTAQEACDPAYWSGHLRHTVRFSDALRTLLDGDADVLLEVGPGRTLGTLARRHPAYRAGRPVLASLPHPVDPVDSGTVMLTAAGRLWQAGVAIEWPALHDGQTRRRTHLPTYPFERRRFRLDAPATDHAHEEPDTGAVAIETERPGCEQAHVAPATATERTVASAFGDVLGVRRVGSQDDFFELGGDSLIGARLITVLKRTVGVELTVRALFAARTPARLAVLIDEQRDAAPAQPVASPPGESAGPVARTAPRTRWLLRRTPRPAAPLRLYCFPHSGGSAGEYLAWSDELPEVELWGLQLPGRGGRMGEAPPTTMERLVDAIVSEVEFSAPYAFFGHSLGALVAYETAVELARRGLPGPRQLVLSASPAPHRHRPGPALHRLDGAELVAAIETEYGPLPRELHDDPELRAMLLVGLRADLEILAHYRSGDAEPLACRIEVLGGSDDTIAESDLAAWERYTSASLGLRIFPGDHFYFRPRPDETLRHLASVLAGRARDASFEPFAAGARR